MIKTIWVNAYNALTDVLDWSEAQAGKLSANDGQLQFSSIEQKAELQTLIAKLNVADANHAAALKEAMATQEKANQANLRVAKDTLAR